MISLRKPYDCPRDVPSQTARVRSGRPNARVYDGRFWLAFASNLSTAMAVALLFRYADLVSRLGGGEFELGWIVGVGMLGSLVMRFVLGQAIDRHGAGTVWLVSLAVVSAACFGHLLLSSCHGPAIYVLRILYASSIAGVFGSSLTWVGSRVPRARLAEMVGMLGTSGFVAMGAGTYLGDLLAGGATEAVFIQRLFLVAGSLTATGMVFCWLATRGPMRQAEPSHASMAKLLWRYSPRFVLLVGVATGVALGLPGTFLRTFTAELGIARMATFFGVYAGAAVITRICARRWPERFGLAPIILLGLVLLVAGLLSFLLVQAAWQLVIPAVIFGVAHAIVFPPTIAASTLSFPEHCRGLGTMLILAAYDLGVLIGAPLAGAVVQYSDRFGLPPYPTMFVTMAALVGLISVVFSASLVSHAPAKPATGSGESQSTPAAWAPPAEIDDAEANEEALVSR
ncbi:MAG: MFS transporter [Pirellulales bacterium]|nr:MFS transporter [Pirellulales bacterium]